MDDAQQEITDKLDKELNRYIGQYAALFTLNEELEFMIHGETLKSPMLKRETVLAWLKRLQDIVQEGLQTHKPHSHR